MSETKKRAVSLSICVLAMAIGGAVGAFTIASTPYSVMAEGEETSLPSTSYDQSSSSEESSSAGELVDSDGNGIPDAIEDYYAKHIQEQYMFGISLGSLIGLATSVIGWLIMFMKNKGYFTKMNSWMSAQEAKSDSALAKYTKLLDKADEENKRQASLIASQRLIVDEINKRNDELMAKLAEDEGKLAALSKSASKINAILDNTVLLTKTSELVKNGVAQKASENAEEAK